MGIYDNLGGMMVTARTKKGVDDQSFVVYVDRAERITRVHRLSCLHVFRNGGVSSGDDPDTWYIGFFAERKAAELHAGRTGYNVDFRHECRE